VVNFQDGRRGSPTADGSFAPPAARVSCRLGPADAATVLSLCALATCWSWRLGTTFSHDYDEGVYLVSAREMLHGAVPFRDLFSSQPPAYLWMLRTALALGGDTVGSGRALSIVSAVIACAALGVLSRRLFGRPAALAAVVLCGCSPVFISVAHTCQPEALALALAISALSLVTGAGQVARGWREVGAGMLFGLALSTKLLMAPLALPLLWFTGGYKGAARVVGSAAAVVLAVAFPHDLRAVLDQAVGFHLDALRQGAGSHVGLREFFRGGGYLWFLALGGCLVRRRRPRLLVGLLLWIGPSAAFLLVHRPIFSHHLSLLAPPLALASSSAVAAVREKFGRVPALVLVALTVLLDIDRGASMRVSAPRPEEVAALEAIERYSSPEQRVVSDDQMLVFRAGRRVAGDLVDTSFVRMDTGSLTLHALERAVGSGTLVVVWTGRFYHLPGFADWLRERCEPLLEFPDAAVPGRGLHRARPPP